MNRIAKVAAFFMAAFLVHFSAMAQKKEINAAIKNDVRSFEGYYYVDLSKKHYSEEEVRAVCRKNGYLIHSFVTEKVLRFGDRAERLTAVTFLPVGKDPDPKKGRVNPPDEPYKTITKMVRNGIRKGIQKFGTMACDFKNTDFKLDKLGAIKEVIKAQNCTFISYKSEIDWAGGHVGDGNEILNKVYYISDDLMPVALLAKSFSGVSVSKNMKTGRVKLDPDRDVWVEDVVWTGSVVDGKISGKGYGAKYINKYTKQGLVIEGTFKNGLPSGNVLYRYGTIDRQCALSLYGKFDVWDNDFRDAGVSITMIPTADAGVTQIERSRITKDAFNHEGIHNTRWGFVNDKFETLSWIPINSEIVQPMKNGKAVIRHRAHGKDNAEGIFYTVTDKITYNFTVNGEMTMADDELNELLSQYDAIMGNWDEMLKPYIEDSNPYQMSQLWKMESRWDNSLKQIDYSLLTRRPLDMIRAKRSNYKQFEQLKQLSRLNELVFMEESFSYSFIYNHPNYMRQRKSEAEKIMSTLRDDKDFNPPYMEPIFTYYSNSLDQDVAWYDSQKADAVEHHNKREEKWTVAQAEYDTERSYAPSGKKVYSFWGTDYILENDGYAYLKNGDYVHYRTVFKSNGDVDHHEVIYSPLELKSQYGSFNEMIKALREASLGQ